MMTTQFGLLRNVTPKFSILLVLYVLTLVACEHLEFSVENRYSEVYGKPGQHLEWIRDKVFAEPYIESFFSVTSPKESVEYTWEIKDDADSLLSEFKGSKAVYTFTRVGNYRITLTATEGEYQKIASNDVIVKYVRREIRKLFPQDRNDLLDAMKVMWSIDDEQGKEIYGKTYTSVLTLLTYHQTLAGDRTCDHMHDGYGFISHHSALSLLFEQSLQTIDPKLSLPYWDYIYDIEEWNSVKPEMRWDFTQSELFSNEYFGNTDTTTHYISDGRWANLLSPKVEDLPKELQDDIPHNAFGYLRAPWSNNEDPHVMRAQTVCGSLTTKDVDSAGRCISLRNLWHQDNFEDFFHYISYMPHGRIHLLTGGALNCDAAFNALYNLQIKTSELDMIKSLAFAMQKNLYRWEMLECDKPESCYCPDLEDILDDETLMNKFLNDALISLHMTAYSADVKKRIILALCNSNLIDGDQLQSSSSYNPEFWTIHPTVERMYQVKKLGAKVEKMIDENWPSSGTWLVYKDECKGHNEDDPVLGGMAQITFKDQLQQFTNKEFLSKLDPNKDTGLTYIYDDLSWDYCGAEFGVDIYAQN